MTANKGKPNALGNNPFNQGIFSKTSPPSQKEDPPVPSTDNLESTNQESTINNQEYILNNKENFHGDNQESTINNLDSRFNNKENREAVNLRLPIELNDWLNELLKLGKRRHGSKIPKEVWVQAALELFRAMPVNWEEIDSEEKLEEVLFNLEARINNLE